MTEMQVAEIFVPVNDRTIDRFEEFLSTVILKFGDLTHSRYEDPWSDDIGTLARFQEIRNVPYSSVPRLPFLGYFTPEPGAPQEVEETVMIKIGVERSKSQWFQRNLIELHQKIVAEISESEPDALGERQSWVIFYDGYRVP